MIQVLEPSSKNALKTPILFLVFNRLRTTKKVFQSIRHAKPTKLYVACDGPRHEIKKEVKIVESVKDYILNSIDWECEVKTLFREENLGCKYAVSSAIDWFFKNENQGIILEDDCLPNHSFFWYCEELLQKYQYDMRIWHISGNNFQKEKPFNDLSYYFSKHNHIWGWATWANRWKKYDVEMKSYLSLDEHKKFDNMIDNNKEKVYWSNIFKKCSRGEINTWDYQWTYAVWKNGGLTIAPNLNLVSNIGFGEGATHTTDLESEHANMSAKNLKLPLKHPDSIERDIDADNYTTKIMFSNPNIFIKATRRLAREFKKFKKNIKFSK